MIQLQILLQIILAVGLVNVWILRFSKPTPYRGADSATMKSEFLAYGLPGSAVYIVGGLKLICASLLLAGIWMPIFVFPATLLLTALMIGAIVMHKKVKDPLVKSAPALLMLTMCVALIFIRQPV